MWIFVRRCFLLVLVSVFLNVQAGFAEDAVVAKVLGKTVSKSQLVPSEQQKERFRTRYKEDQLQKWLDSYRRNRLTGMIFGPLLAQFADAHTEEPTAKEMEIFRSAVTGSPLSKALEGIQKEFDSKVVDGKMPEAEVVKWMSMVKGDPPGKKYDSKEVRNYQEHPDTLLQAVKDKLLNEENRMYRKFLRSYKVNQALYKKYGGRVIFQQAGPEPIDAYTRFLKEQEKKGAFEIINASYKEDFWHYFTNDKMHNFLPEDEAKRAMTTAWWEQARGPGGAPPSSK